jgi:hypothetical protein
MRRRISILTIITDPTIILIEIIFILAVIYNLNHGGIVDAIKVVFSGITGIIIAASLVALVVAILLYDQKWELIGHWIIDQIAHKKR